MVKCSLLISIKSFIFLKKKIYRERSHQKTKAHVKGKGEKWHLITNSRCLKRHVFWFSVWNLLKKPSNYLLADFPYALALPICLTIQKTQSQKDNDTEELQLLSFFKYWPFTKKLTRALPGERAEKWHFPFSTYFPSWATTHARSLLRRARRPFAAPPCPTPREQGAETALIYFAFTQSHALRRERNYRQLAVRWERSYEHLWDNYGYKATDTLYEVLLRKQEGLLGTTPLSLESFTNAISIHCGQEASVSFQFTS